MSYLVRDRLFFGNTGAAAEALTTTTGGEITHVLSLLSDRKPGTDIPTEKIDRVFVGGDDDGSAKRSLSPEKLLCSLERAGPETRIRMMAVPLRDAEDENLFECLELCLGFIEEGRKEGAVLVHSFAGVSRSAAIITAYLMRTEQRSLKDALESLQEVCEFVCPNDGFVEQLKLFEGMGFKVDTANPLYKRFRLEVLGRAYNQGEKVDNSTFQTDPGLTPESISSEVATKGDKLRIVYRCNKCRRAIAAPENVVSHRPGENATIFEGQKRKWQKRKSGNPNNKFGEAECFSMFVEPLRWMTSVEEGALEGKLTCLSCDARLGYFNWAGVQCSCGSWITPAFQIHKNKIDISIELA